MDYPVFLLFLFSLIYPSSCIMKDLTHLLRDGSMAIWPGNTPFQKTLVYAGPLSADVPWVATNEMRLSEHIGTHIDVPYHFNRNGSFLHEIPLERFEGPAVVINIEERAELDANAMVMAEDLKAWEETHGKIPKGAWIIMASGWSKRWPDQWDFVGTNDSAVPGMRYPGFSVEAVQWLFDNRAEFSGIAVDTVSCDNGNNSGVGNFMVHVQLLGRNYLCVEMLKDPELIPISGATLHVLPMKIYEGSGAPSRAYATWNEDGGQEPPTPCSASFISGTFGLIATMMLVAIFD